ncbi:MAG TPA: carbohydrate kinase family protein, partial [Flavihumibacter sp.]|nr:carbohydrate kinase family protein [Flavihumibacter sp.]
METNFDVLVAGELNVDLIFDDLQQRPVTGKEVIANRMTLSLGSSAAIFASNLQTIGMRVSFIGKLGEDMFGQFMLSALSAAGVNTQWIEQNARWKTGASVALN